MLKYKNASKNQCHSILTRQEFKDVDRYIQSIAETSNIKGHLKIGTNRKELLDHLEKSFYRNPCINQSNPRKGCTSSDSQAILNHFIIMFIEKVFYGLSSIEDTQGNKIEMISVGGKNFLNFYTTIV